MVMLVGLLGSYSNHDSHPVPIPNPAPEGFAANVLINGRPAHHVGNTFIEHTIPTFPPPPIHPDVILTGHATVWIGGGPAAVVGLSDIVALPPGVGFGSRVLTGSHSVFLGDAPIIPAVPAG
jgi:uncharacterized Zn-binding protein involved in type VI secretion|tara:strand:+ start:1752 stop:2117 length:366 start_codon:yes stop_codon:yes gene_type:complete